MLGKMYTGLEDNDTNQQKAGNPTFRLVIHPIAYSYEKTNKGMTLT